jgi:streptomycin 6-kinase
MTKLDTPLEHYLEAWQLSEPRPLAQTPTSHVYTVRQNGTTVVLKLLTSYGVEERVGALALRHFDGRGAVRLLRSDADAQLLEYADGDDLGGLVQNGQDAAATAIIGDVISALHANNAPPPEGITPLSRWFRALFVQAETERARGTDSIFVRAAALAGPVLADQRDLRVLHSDIHHENIRQSPRGWLAFDPKGLYGERAYDLANTLCNPRPIYGVETADERRILRNSAILAERCGLDQRRVLLFLYLYACLSASWTLQDAGEGIANVLEIAAIAERHL